MQHDVFKIQSKSTQKYTIDVFEQLYLLITTSNFTH